MHPELAPSSVRRRRLAASLLAVAALASPGEATSARSAPLSPSRAQSWSVAPGTTALLVEDHRSPLVEIRLVFPAGRWSPWFQRSRHFDEAFALQLRDPAGALRARADRLGLEVTLTTDARASTLALGCRKDQIDSAAVWIRDLLANREFDKREIKRGNVQKDLEWSAAQKNPQTTLRRAVRRLLFAPQDPRRVPYEKPEHVPGDWRRLAAARDTLVRHPGRVIGLAGDLSRVEAERLATRLLPPALAAPPANGDPALRPLLPAERRPRRQEVRIARLTQVYLALARDAPGATDPDYVAFTVADHVLGGHFYSRLFQALRHGAGDTYATGTIRDYEPATGAYGAWTYSRTANAETAEKKLRETLRVFHERGITEQERADAIGYLAGRRAFGVQSPGQVLDRLLWDRSRGLPAGFRDRLADRAAELSLEQINEFARRFYDPARFTLIRVEPK